MKLDSSVRANMRAVVVPGFDVEWWIIKTSQLNPIKSLFTLDHRWSSSRVPSF